MEQRINRRIGHGITFFLSLLALLVLAAAVIGAAEVALHDMPRLWSAPDEYAALHLLLQKILLIAIAAELGLLLLFHRPSAAVEVVMFVIARRLVATDVSPLDLLVGSAALAGLLAVRFYFLPGHPDWLGNRHGYDLISLCLVRGVRNLGLFFIQIFSGHIILRDLMRANFFFIGALGIFHADHRVGLERISFR